MAVGVANEAPFVADPTVAAVLSEKPIFHAVAANFEQSVDFGLHPGKIVGMDAASPEVRALQIFGGLVAEHIP